MIRARRASLIGPVHIVILVLACLALVREVSRLAMPAPVPTLEFVRQAVLVGLIVIEILIVAGLAAGLAAWRWRGWTWPLLVADGVALMLLLFLGWGSVGSGTLFDVTFWILCVGLVVAGAALLLSIERDRMAR